MEAEFVNVYTDTEKMFREITAKIGMRKSRLWLVVYILLDLYYILFLLPHLNLTGWVVFLVCIGYTIWICIQPIYRGKAYIKKMKKYYGGAIPETVVEFGEEITVRGPDSVASVPYNKITKVYFLKNSIVLRADKVSTVVISPVGFTKGTVSEFYEFLCEKCPQLKLLRGSGKTLY